ncbi:MAG: hypothetical protein MK095_10575, partial [Phycisphaerales bacterium]|nr:hypothetical protein [Phycisphaerales bacterium]
MSPDPSRVQEIFNAAQSVEASARQKWLIDACGSDAELLAEVTSLLEHASPASGPNDPTIQESAEGRERRSRHQP